MLASDRDLLILEPTLFRDVVWLGQRLSRGGGTISGTVLTFASPDVALEDAGVTSGHVATVAGVSYEVIERVGANQVHVSRPRASAAGTTLPPSPVAGADAWVVTFSPQIALAEAQVLRMLGIDAEAAAGPAPDGGRRLTAADITNPEALRRLVALGALHLVFAGASVLGGPESAHGERAAWYRTRFADERARVVVELDTDGDGQPDATRTLNAFRLSRA